MRVDKTITIGSNKVDLEVHQSDRKISERKCHDNAYEIKIEFTTNKELSNYEIKRIEERIQLDFSYLESTDEVGYQC